MSDLRPSRLAEFRKQLHDGPLGDQVLFLVCLSLITITILVFAGIVVWAFIASAYWAKLLMLSLAFGLWRALAWIRRGP